MNVMLLLSTEETRKRDLGLEWEMTVRSGGQRSGLVLEGQGGSSCRLGLSTITKHHL